MQQSKHIFQYAKKLLFHRAVCRIAFMEWFKKIDWQVAKKIDYIVSSQWQVNWFLGPSQDLNIIPQCCAL
jgi:hypothetical protein